MHSKHCMAYGLNRPITLLSVYHFHALPRSGGRACSCGRLTRNWIRQHHRLLHSLRPRHGNGADMWASIRGEEIQTPRPNDAEDSDSPPPNFNLHRILMAQHEENLTPMRPARRHRHRSSILHSLLSTGSRRAIAAPPSANLPSKPISYSAINILCSSLNPPSHPHQLPPRLGSSPRNQRHCFRRCLDKFQSGYLLDYLHLGFWDSQENMDWNLLCLLQRLESAFESSDSELHFGLPRMVVV